MIIWCNSVIECILPLEVIVAVRTVTVITQRAYAVAVVTIAFIIFIIQIVHQQMQKRI